MNIKIITSLAILIILFLAVIYWQLYAYKTPQPTYEIIKSDNQIEIRKYPALIFAEVSIPGERYKSINDGFRILAGYIFGKNQKQQKISMTAPVEQMQSKDGWIVRFIMPAEFKISSLPKPLNPDIKLTQSKSNKYIAIRFSGSNTDENIQKHNNILLEYIKKNNIKTVGMPIMAFYNPPWILPFLRRNEILIQLE